MTGLVFFLFLALIAARYLTSTLTRSARQPGASRQLQALAERLRAANRPGRLPAVRPPAGWAPPQGQSGAPTSGPPSQPPVPPPAQVVIPVVLDAAPTVVPEMVVPPAPAPPHRTSSSLDSSLSSSLADTGHDAEHQMLSGPRVVELPPDLQRRAMEYMNQNYEVMAVRLVCDEMHVGILDAQKTVRTLAGLPNPY